jgi:DNA-binding response OmpR family regulator
MPCPPTLLIVEDDPQTRALLQGFLSELGFAAHFVSDGAAVLRTLEQSVSLAAQDPGRVDMVIVDLEARRRSGLDILVTVRRNRWRTPVVLTSPFVSSMLRAEVVRMGAVAILSKPVSLQELEGVLRGVVFP